MFLLRARVLIPELGEQTSLSGQFLFLLAVVVYLSLGGHRLFLEAFCESYRILPILSLPSATDFFSLIDYLGILTGKVIFMSMQISMPVLIAIFIADIILGVANRFAPQINVWEMGFNIRGYLGVLILFVALTVVVRQIEHYSGESVPQVRETMERFKNPSPTVPEAAPTLPEPEKPLDIPVQNIPSQ